MTAIAQRCYPVLQPTQHQAMTGTAQLVLTPALHSGCPRRGGRRHRSVGGRVGHRAAPGARQPLSRSPGLALHAGGCRMCPLGRKKGSPRPGRKGDLPPARAPASHVANKTIPPVHLRNSFGLFWPRAHSGKAVLPAARGSLDKSPGHCRDCRAVPLRHPRPLTCLRLHPGCHHFPAALKPPRPEASSLKHKPDSPLLALLPSILPSLGLKGTASKPAPASLLRPLRWHSSVLPGSVAYSDSGSGSVCSPG